MKNFNEIVSNYVSTYSSRQPAVHANDNPLICAMKQQDNYTLTENGGVSHKTTNSALLDMFGMGGAMRNRSEEDIILMFKKAYAENPVYTLKCLFYIRDVRGGQGERRFFRTCLKWLVKNDTNAVLRNLEEIPTYGRYDDLFVLFDTPAEETMLKFVQSQLAMDITSAQRVSGAVSLLAKWMPSSNASSRDTRALANRFIKYFNLTPREYRKMLSYLRKRINVLERLMSANEWDKIDFSGIPSRASLIYRESFKRHEGERYAAFVGDKHTKVNAKVLNPVDIAHQIFSRYGVDDVDRAAWDKAWSCLPDYYHGKEEPGIAIVDVSGSMSGVPMEAAVSMGAYIAERGKGPFRNHFITFSSNPELVEFEGADLYDKFRRARNADWGGSTNIEAAFNLILNTARKAHVHPQDMPKTLYIFSDMEFNSCMSYGPVTYGRWSNGHSLGSEDAINTVIETQMRKWRQYGYTTPRVIFWNLDARSPEGNIPAIGDKFSYVSGFSMNMVEQSLGGKDGISLMFEKLDSPRYAPIH